MYEWENNVLNTRTILGGGANSPECCLDDRNRRGVLFTPSLNITVSVLPLGTAAKVALTVARDGGRCQCLRELY